MSAEILKDFRLVGGTALSLHIGHRISVDIDLFTEKDYGSVDFSAIEDFFRDQYNYVDVSRGEVVGFGKMYMIGGNEWESVKVDLMYTDAFIREPIIVDQIRLASIEDIIAMKLEIVALGGRKKDFWDLHALMGDFSIDRMLELHKERYPYSHDGDAIRKGFCDFSKADEELNPDCLQGKHWEIIRADMIEFSRPK
jgi:hypothetical protein